MPMKWFFGLSEASLSADGLHADCIRVAVMSANRNTRLTPYLLYDGTENRFTDEMRSRGVNIVRHRTTLYDHIVADKPDDQHFIRVASGALLRIDIPLIEQDDEFVLYTDCDVMFLKDPDLEGMRPTYFSVAPEFTRGNYENMNTGVMFINVPNMRLIHEEFVCSVRKSRISDHAAYDQDFLRAYFKGKYDKLPETLNWKPYWGKNDTTEIVHFHGPKPPHIKALLDNTGTSVPHSLMELYQKEPNYYEEITRIWYATLADASSKANPNLVGSAKIPEKFERRGPSSQTAVDIFAGRWASNLQAICGVTGTGTANVFSDARVKMAADALGKNGRFEGACILELGPLEAAHTYQIERLGAERVVAVESNAEAYLKCLVVKELLQLKSQFLCGDAIAYLEEITESYDLIFCSGLLYHMADPVSLIRLICHHAPSCFVWTHYQSDQALKQNQRKVRPVINAGFETTYYEVAYPDMNDGRFWGGNTPIAAWMTQGEIIRAFRHFGFTCSTILQDHPDHPNGSAFSLAVWR
jgi:hypothetical protein